MYSNAADHCDSIGEKRHCKQSGSDINFHLFKEEKSSQANETPNNKD